MEKEILQAVFDSTCNGGKVIIEYRDNDGYKVRGLAFDLLIQQGVAGKDFIYVDSFSNRVTIDRVISTKII